jgi:predicted nuclease with TOPRIM domain
MEGHFQALAEALERVERSSANMNESIKSLRQEPTNENAQAMIDELRALQKELTQIDQKLRNVSPYKTLDMLRTVGQMIGKPTES